MEHQTDSQIMHLIQAGDAAELAHLFERHHLGLFRYLVSLTGDRALSEDLTQEVFLRVLKYAKSFKPDFEFRSWIYGMARNALHDARHKIRGEMGDAVMTDLPSSAPVPDENLSREQHARLLHQALGRLSSDKREVLELSRFQDLRYEEIARILQCEVGTVKVRVYRALKELRERFFELSGRQTV